MREIKFRGTDVYTGEKRYGFYLEDEDGANILDIKNISRAYLVDRDSVAQLVGRDKNGSEVYEGDRCIFADSGAEFTARLHRFDEWLRFSTLKKQSARKNF